MLAKYTIAGVGRFRCCLPASRSRRRRPQPPTAPTPARRLRPQSDTSSSFQGDWRASKMVGLSVYNDKNESVGSINDLLTDKSGNIKAVVIGVGGFLGVGEHLVAVPFDKMKFVNEPVVYTGAADDAERGRRSAAPVDHDDGCGDTPRRRRRSKPNPWYPDHAVFNATKDELKAMPEFKYSTN